MAWEFLVVGVVRRCDTERTACGAVTMKPLLSCISISRRFVLFSTRSSSRCSLRLEFFECHRSQHRTARNRPVAPAGFISQKAGRISNRKIHAKIRVNPRRQQPGSILSAHQEVISEIELDKRELWSVVVTLLPSCGARSQAQLVNHV